MTCPICDQKPMNCDCTETERRQHQEIEELRLTDEEREALEHEVELAEYQQRHELVATLRRLLERLT